jgi:hypothetical protein
MRHGQARYYLVKSMRIRDAEGKSRVRQKVLAYLGQFDNVEDAFCNAGLKRRRKLSMYRNPQDMWNDQRERALEREYRRQISPRDELKLILHDLPEMWCPLDFKQFGLWAC